MHARAACGASSCGHRDKMRVTVQEVARPVAVDPLAQPFPTDVGRVVGIIVDPKWRAVADQHFGRGQPARELAALLLRAVLIPPAP